MEIQRKRIRKRNSKSKSNTNCWISLRHLQGDFKQGVKQHFWSKLTPCLQMEVKTHNLIHGMKMAEQMFYVLWHHALLHADTTQFSKFRKLESLQIFLNTGQVANHNSIRKTGKIWAITCRGIVSVLVMTHRVTFGRWDVRLNRNSTYGHDNKVSNARLSKSQSNWFFLLLLILPAWFTRQRRVVSAKLKTNTMIYYSCIRFVRIKLKGNK